MADKRQRTPLIKVIDDTIKLPDKSGNGLLKISVNVDNKGQLSQYSLAYINDSIFSGDHGRVLGYDNSHGYHHRHYMGKVNPVEFNSYEAIAEQFEKEWRALHEKIKKRSR